MKKEEPKQNRTVGEWKKATTDDGRVYYYNTVTKESRWTKPKAETTLIEHRLNTNSKNNSLWSPVKMEDGRIYYFNKVTRETRWTNPDNK